MLTKSRNIDGLKKILTPEKILTGVEERYIYAQDATNTRKSKQLPDAVVFPESIEEVQAIVRYANKYHIPLICRGAGTNLVGACFCDYGGIVMCFSKMNKIININKVDMTATVQPGVVVGDLQTTVEKMGLFFPPDPSNLRVSTIGGAIAQSAGGPRTFKYGGIKDYVLDLKVVLSDGSIVQTGSNTIKNATGYNLGQLFIGSEGTLGIVVEALLKLIPKPEASQVIMAYFDSVKDAAGSVNTILQNRFMPSTLDFMDGNAITTVEKFFNIGLNTEKDALLIIEIDGFECSMDYQRESIIKILNQTGASGVRYSTNEEEAKKIWKARRASFAATAKLKPDVLTDDVIVSRSNLGKLVKGIKAICDKYNLIVSIVGHVGDGNVHPQIALNLDDEKEYNNYKEAKKEIYKLTISLGGIISAEHGIGVEKKDFLPKVVNGLSLEYMKKVKKVFDAKNILNPGKIFD